MKPEASDRAFVMDLEPIPVERWAEGGGRQYLCEESCCVFRRLASVARRVTSEAELIDALTRPEVFYREPA